MLAYSPIEYKYLETIAKTFSPDRIYYYKMNTNSAFTGYFTENPYWYQQFGLRHIRILRDGQSVIDYDTSDNCRLYVQQ